MDPRLAPPQGSVPQGTANNGGNISMVQAVILPFPSITTNENRIYGRNDRLRAIISNLNDRHGQVQQNILAQAKSEQQKILSSTSPRPPANPPFLDNILEKGNQDTAAMLRTCYCPDVVMSTHGASNPRRSSLATASTSNRDARTAMTLAGQQHVALLKETIEKLDEYDGQAAKTVDYYQRALDRNMGGGGPTDDEATPAAASHEVRPRKSVTFAPETTRGNGKGQVTGEWGSSRGTASSSYDAHRDPRLR